jgi:hypothetical protein
LRPVLLLAVQQRIGASLCAVHSVRGESASVWASGERLGEDGVGLRAHLL